MNTEERLDYFGHELEAISDSRLKEFTKLCLAAAPDYIFIDCPSSSSGKYHPLNELSWDGTLIHTKKAFNLAYALTKGLSVESNRDLILIGILLHDMVKRGWTNETGHTQWNHPQLGAELIDMIQADTQLLNDEEYRTIRNCIFYHYGPWTKGPASKPMTEYSLEELCVYISDFVVTQRFIDVQYRDVEHD